MSKTASWNGVSGIWRIAANWTPGVVPDSTTAVTIDAAGAYWVAINTPAEAASVTIDTPLATDPLLINNTLAIGTDLTVTSGKLVLDEGGVIEGGTISMGPNGKIVYNGGAFDGVTYQGTLDMSRAGSALTIE
jgi:hypothetical protein